jgi:DNA-binding response OmpR family regulator
VRWAARFAADLAGTGLDVRTCNDGQAAIDTLREWPADVVLLDERMPGMDGQEVCRRLRKDGYPGAILIYSAYDTESDVVLAHTAGADDHVSKTASAAVVRAKIRRAVQRVRDRLPPRSSRHLTSPTGIRDLLRTLERDEPVDWGSLTKLEEHLLCRLVCANGQVVSAESLLVEGWGKTDQPSSRLYEPISNLREKLAPLGWRVRNARGKGYWLERLEQDEAADDGEGGTTSVS